MNKTAIPGVLMRGGTSKGLFFRTHDLPLDLAERDELLARLVGSPDPYGRQTDGLGGATSSTSKVVLVSRSARQDCDVDFLFGAVSIASGRIDWSGNCGNLSAAVGPYAVAQGLVAVEEGHTTVRIWQQNIEQRIIARVPTHAGQVLESGRFKEDGVPFCSAEVVLEFLAPSESAGARLLPTGRLQDALDIPELGCFQVSYINAGNPTVFMRAKDLQCNGRELPAALNRDGKLLARLELIRSHAAVAMGLARSPQHARQDRPATPKLAWVAPPASYRTSAGVEIDKHSIDVVARMVSLGQCHHAFTGTGAIALAAAAALPGTLVSEVTRTLPGVATRIGHASGILTVGAFVEHAAHGWRWEKAIMSRSARRLMQGDIFLPPA